MAPFSMLLRCRVLFLMSMIFLAQAWATPPVTLQCWNDFTGKERATFERLVRKFNRQKPACRVIPVTLDWTLYTNKLASAAHSKNPPDLFILPTEMLQRVVETRPETISLQARALDDLLPGPNGLNPDDMVPAAWNAASRKGKHYGIPLDIMPQVQFTHAVSPKNGTLVFTWPRANIASIMMQWGGSFFSPDGTTCCLNQPQNIEALAYCHRLLEEHRAVLPPARDGWHVFEQNTSSSALGGLNQIRNLSRHTGLSPFPVIGKTPAVYATSHLVCMQKDLAGDRLSAAWRFVCFLSDEGIAWTVNGQLPVRQSQLADPRFQKRRQAELVSETNHLFYFPQNAVSTAFAAEFDRAVDDALLGHATAQEALNRATENINQLLQQAPESIKQAQ